jgi:hypothetical protein
MEMSTTIVESIVQKLGGASVVRRHDKLTP